MAEAATCNGVSGGSSKKAFFLATAAAGTLLSAWLFRRCVFFRQPASPPLVQRTEPEGVKSLAAPERVEPTPTNKLLGQHCARCRSTAQGKGSWYNLKGRLYCQACAQGQAEKVGDQLVRPARAKPGTNLKYPQTGRRTSLKPRMVKVGAVDNVAGYAVWTGKKDTGLTLVPAVKLAANGQIKIDKSRWFVHYDRAGKPVAGPYGSVDEARRMTSILAHFDWTKAVEDFKDEEIRAVTQLANDYRAEIEFAHHIRQITATVQRQ